MEYYKVEKPNPRNYALIMVGLYTALRISDILSLRWKDIYDFERNDFRRHIFIQEQKTGKQNVIALNVHTKQALSDYMQTRQPDGKDYIFTKNTDYHTPLCRAQAFRIIKKAAQGLSQKHVSCHSMRKTFGYHAWKQGTPPALLMDIYNHSSYQITKKYLGIEQDERDAVFLSLDI